jgi:hypothetical protein
MANVLALPLVQMSVVTGTNEDWVDSIKYLVDPQDGTLPADMPQLDLTGITFEMEVRRQATDSEVIFAASTTDGTILIGTPPDNGFLIISVPVVEMQNVSAGPYVADVTGRDNYNTRRTLQIDLTVVDGITIRPVNARIVVQPPTLTS